MSLRLVASWTVQVYVHIDKVTCFPQVHVGHFDKVILYLGVNVNVNVR